jgi:hypothetical protein
MAKKSWKKTSEVKKESTIESSLGWKEGSIAVIGEGWTALGAVADLLAKQQKVTWISGTGVAPFSPLPTIDSGKGSTFWAKLFFSYGLIDEMPKEGLLLREYRKSAFHSPDWQKGDNEEDRRALHREHLWEGERTLMPFEELIFETSIQDLEIALREKVFQSVLLKKSSAQRMTEIVTVESGDEPGIVIHFGEGESIRVEKLIYADSLESANDIVGMPRFSAPFRGKKRQSLLQVVAKHSATLQDFAQSGFFGPTNRDAGEEVARLVFGGFFEGGTRSVWNMLIAEGEAEDNQMIAKKLRRMKQALDKMFSGPGILPEGKAFTQTWSDESVRFLENAIFYGKTPADEVLHEPKVFGSSGNILYLADGFGVSSSGAQVESAATAWANGEDSDMNSFRTSTAQEAGEVSERLT